ncbi:MAG TPA: tetratricopeptide repeat protein [Methylotenera sp.]|nr:tetratricopeptide repeat protein [Methylotenera sp.]
MKSQITLALLSTTLFFNNVYAMDADTSACNHAVEKGDGSTALQLAEKVLRSNKNDKEALICKGRALSLNGDTANAISTFKLATAQAATPLDKTIIAILSGNAYKKNKQYDEAIASYQLAVTNAQADKNQQFERISLNLIGDTYFEGKRYQEALDTYLAASKLVENDNDRGESFENIANTYHSMNKNDEALEYQIKAYFMNERVGTLDQYARSSIELGRYYIINKNYKSAENILNKIIKFAKDQGGAYYEAQGSYLLAKVNVANGDVAGAKTLVDNAKTIAKNTNDQALAQEIDQETQGMF